MGLRLKVLLIATGVTVGVMGVILASTSYLFTLRYSNALQSRALAISKSLKIQLERVLQFGIKVEDLVGFEEQCRDAVDGYEGITYASVTTPGGRIIFHSDPTQIGRTVSDPLVADALGNRHPAGAVVFDAEALDYGAIVPVLDPRGQHVASIAVGLPADKISQEVRKTVRIGLAAGIAVLIVGTILLAAALSAFVTRPLGHLIDTIRRISSNRADYSLRVPARGNGEIGSLIESFNSMLAEIERRDTQLKISKEQADAANQAKSQFLARMSHELRTPMNGVLGIIDILLRSPLSHRQRHFLGMAQHSGSSLLAIVSDILDFSKIEAGKLVLDRVAFDLRETVEEVATLLAEGAQRKGVEFACVIAPSLPARVWGDPWRLRQILVNLVSNAVKFTERGEIVIGVREGLEDRIHFSVSDTGIGIEPAVAATLFQPFVQADNSTSRRFGGTGLGLAIVKQLVEMQDGTIHVDSIPEKGSTFSLVLPLPAASPAASPGVALDGMRVMVVDNNPTSRSILLRYLSGWGVAAASAATGAEALGALRAAAANGQPFDLAIVDAALPDVSGPQFVSTAWGEGALRNLKMILLATPTESCNDVPHEIAGAVPRLLKPVRHSHLLASIASALGVGVPTTDVHDAPSLPRSEDGAISAEVLLVEDNQVNQEVALAILEDMGCRVTIADDGHQALNMLAGRRFDAVLMDCHLPTLDGFDTTRIFRHREAESTLPRTPIIALTASAMEGDRERCLTCGMDDYLVKPFAFDGLRAALRRWACPADRSGTGEGISSLNPGALQVLQAMQRPGRPDLVSRVLGIFRRDAPRLMADMHEGFRCGNAEAMRRAAHSLKSASANVGAIRLAELCHEIEDLARDDEIATVAAPLARVETELDRVMAALARREVTA